MTRVSEKSRGINEVGMDEVCDAIRGALAAMALAAAELAGRLLHTRPMGEPPR